MTRATTGTAIGVCWSVFLIVWVIGALYNTRHAPVTRRRAGLSPSLVGGAMVAWLLLRAFPTSTWASLQVHASAVRLFGTAILIAGTVFTIWARVVLGTMWSSTPVAKEDHELRRGGPYAVVRHPIYTGVLTMIAGTALANSLGWWISVFVVAVVAAEFKLRTEERLMLEVFGAAYEQYRREVPQLVPGLKRRSRV